MRPRTLLILLSTITVLMLAATVLLYLARPQFRAENYAYQTVPSGDLPKLWEAPDFAFPDQRGQVVTRAGLRGRPWIVDFFFTQCTAVCPVMTARFVLLQERLAGVDVRFVSISVDPAHDTPAALAAYAAAWNATETRWTLLATEPATLARAVDGFHVTAEPDSDVANPIIHSSVFLLIDGDGWIRGVYDSNDDSAQRRLVDDARRLAAAPGAAQAGEAAPAAAGPPAPRRTRYQALGCAGCHTNPRVAPALDNLLGRSVRLKDGMTLVADRAYLRRAILAPGAEVVAGYVPLMPGYRGALSDAELEELLDEVAAMRTPGAPAADTTAVGLALDPVCDMQVRAAPDAIQAKFGNQVVYFCCESCREHFLAEPVKYLAHLRKAAPAAHP